MRSNLRRENAAAIRKLRVGMAVMVPQRGHEVLGRITCLSGHVVVVKLQNGSGRDYPASMVRPAEPFEAVALITV